MKTRAELDAVRAARKPRGFADGTTHKLTPRLKKRGMNHEEASRQREVSFRCLRG